MCPSGTNSRPEPPSTISEIRPAFDVLDTDRDGKISVNDLRTFYSAFSNTASDEEIGSMISVADSNKDGFVELEEFERVVLGSNGRSSSFSGVNNEVMKEAFQVMDKDGDGKVGFDDLRSYMNWAGFGATDDDIRAMIKLGGGDENEGVGFEGLLKILAVDSSSTPLYL
ncbi:EF-hand domain [Macleaya cordata]|uniref:EF-hand domain n=1 Tax=Macleaya cordata TaxID=56857 RepID=A0A200R246_MACCD|nr:EF-hand domain [Macleaya cordata]